ncbi:hypothetical protein MACK_003987 [Theileria orientalis]|uniref:Uncharacterized protein n=1 Tax=Theileria orientalis TaxID=68886 RepID=A0A976SJQ5_THEOR|nr:hypothetical protein MACK_003987 [Theileria orientalis]
MNWATHTKLSYLSKKYDCLKINALRQKGLLFTNLPLELLESNSKFLQLLSKCNINISNDEVHIKRSRFGYPFGVALALVDQATPNFDFKFDKSDANPSNLSRSTTTSSLSGLYNSIVENLPRESSVFLCDEHEVSCFVEQCERLLTLPEDLRRLSNPEFLHRIVSVTGFTSSYGRFELSEVIQNSTNVKVDPKNIIFRFKDDGYQDSLAWVICDSVKQANTIISKLQEVPVPKRYQYGNLMGAAFLYSSRSSFFLSDPSLDFITKRSKYQVFTMGWHSDVDETELKNLTDGLKFYPKNIKIHKIKSKEEKTSETCAFLEFDRMRNAKKIMHRLQIIKKRWKIPDISAFYAYPKMADVLWKSQNGDYKNDEMFNGDLDEPVEY